MDTRLAKLYDTNEPGIRSLADICDVYINVYSKLKNNIFHSLPIYSILL